MCRDRRRRKDGTRERVRQTEGGSESALETGSSSAKSASETALTVVDANLLPAIVPIYIHISIHIYICTYMHIYIYAPRHVAALPTCNNIAIHNFYVDAVNGKPLFPPSYSFIRTAIIECFRLKNICLIKCFLSRYFLIRYTFQFKSFFFYLRYKIKACILTVIEQNLSWLSVVITESQLYIFLIF